jgi:hypothetical protein
MFVVLYDYVVAGQVGGLPALQLPSCWLALPQGCLSYLDVML